MRDAIIVISSDEETEASTAHRVVPPERKVDSDVISITSSESEDDSPPLSTQLRNGSKRVAVRARAPTRELGSSTRSSTAQVKGPDNDKGESEVVPNSGNRKDPENGCGNLSASGSRPVAPYSALFAAIGGSSLSASKLPSSSSSSNSSSSDSDADLPPALNPNRPPKADDPFGDPFRFELWPAVPELARNTDPTVPKVHWILTVKIWYKVSMVSGALDMPD